MANDSRDVPVWWHKCEWCGAQLPDGVPALVEMMFGCLPNAVYCLPCIPPEDRHFYAVRAVPDGGLLSQGAQS